MTALYITEEAESYEQVDLLQSSHTKKNHARREKLEKTMDGIREKFGSGSIAYGTPKSDLLRQEED